MHGRTRRDKGPQACVVHIAEHNEPQKAQDVGAVEHLRMHAAVHHFSCASYIRQVLRLKQDAWQASDHMRRER